MCIRDRRQKVPGDSTAFVSTRLAAAGVDRFNHNLETSEERYPEICTTHTWRDRVDTVKRARAAGMEARGVFPFNRANGICRAGLETVNLSEDLAAMRGHGSYRIDRPDRSLLTGTTRFRFRGKRL